MSNLVWSWRNAAFGALISSVAVIVIQTGTSRTGLYLLIGAIPAAILGLPPRRTDRRKVLVIGVLFAVPCGRPRPPNGFRSPSSGCS